MKYIKRYKKVLNRILNIGGCGFVGDRIDYINLWYEYYETKNIYFDPEEDTLYKALKIINKDLKKINISKKNIFLFEIPIKDVAIFIYPKKQKEITVYTSKDDNIKYAVYDAYTCKNIEYKTLKECLNSEYHNKTNRYYLNKGYHFKKWKI